MNTSRTPHIRRRFQIGVNRVGSRSFVGNGAILPTGASLGERCLLGVLSAPPSSAQATADCTDWLGSPAFQLPNRQNVLGFGDATTYAPSRKLCAQRAAVDALRILIPSYTGLLHGLAGLAAMLYGYEVYGMGVTFALLPALCLVFAAVAVLIVVRHCFINTGLFSEFDLVKIGDYVALNPGAVIQNHLFEDRIMKSSYLTIENGCSIGNMSVVLYDSRMGEGATLGPLSLLMKGEVMPPGNRWYGIPTVQG